MAQEEVPLTEPDPGTEVVEEPIDVGESATMAASASGGSSGSPGIPGANSSVPGANDILNFQTDLFTGRFSYSVPIIVAPGRQGAEPKLALTYNSAAGNGWCGVGWSLEVGFIERDTKKGVPVAWGTRDVETQYDDSQGFIFNLGGVSGSLINVGGNEYRNEIDGTFLKFVLQSTNTWIVTDKSGNKFYFGDSSASRMQNGNAGWTANVAQSTFRWALSRVIDVNGNQTTLTYSIFNNFLYLTQITYNGNIHTGASSTHSVEFVLEDDRTDFPLSFRSNYRVQLKKRLSEIIVKVNSQRVRRYDLAYINSPSTFRSLLQSVTLYGPTDSDSLPPLTFSYQVKPFRFESGVTWTVNDQGTGSDYWGAIHSVLQNNSDINHDWVKLMDIDGDALPDRVIRKGNSPFDRFLVQRNTGSGFVSTLQGWGQFNSSGDQTWGSTERITTDSGHKPVALRLLDINGDGYPDRVVGADASGENFGVRTNTGLAGATASFLGSGGGWGPLKHESATEYMWFRVASSKKPDPYGHGYSELLDLTGDGLPDRVMRKEASHYTNYIIQKNTGSGFATWQRYGALLSQGAENQEIWGGVSGSQSQNSGHVHNFMLLTDMNGDGLPDRVMRKIDTPWDDFRVQFNNGAGFQPTENIWGPVDSQGSSESSWWAPHSTYTESSQTGVQAMLIDLNGDGLVDRVMRRRPSPYTNFVVQFNTGSGFTSSYEFTGIGADGAWYWRSPQFIKNDGTDPDHITTKVDLIDMNGDALVDRVYYTSSTSWTVQYNKGPFPDLLKQIDNGIGGKVDVTYTPSTQFNNRDKPLTGDPWDIGAKALLPFVIYVVESVTTRDGFGNDSTNTYSYEGGMYDGTRREFRGFALTTVTDPYGGQSRTFFHQGGGQDRTSEGEFVDSGSVAKKGIPFRIETVGTNGLVNTITINKVEEAMLHTNGWCFPFISQTIQLGYEGLATYRATAQQFTYDTNSGNVLKISNFGEVTNVNVAAHTFGDDGTDSVFTHTSYASLGEILNKPELVTITSDSGGTVRLRETKFAYDSRGNLTNQQAWLSGTTYLTTTSIQYDQNGNPLRITDAAGITTENTYDTTYQMFVEQKVTGEFTNQFRYNTHSGALLLAIDAKGLISSNQYDAFFRITNTWISTDLGGTSFIWKERYSYNLGAISGNISYNSVRKQVNDATDDTGHESFVYADGLGRTIQTRVEAENNQFRVADAFYDLRGNPLFATLPRFGSGSGFTVVTGTNLGSYTEYDPFGRAFKVIPAVEVVFDANGEFTDIYGTGGDAGSPVAATVTAFTDGSNPWATVVTDAEGKVKKSFHDAFGRTTQIVEINGGTNYITAYKYDKVGNLTNVTDHAGNKTRIVYDNLGRKTSMQDPDMGTWTYVYDNASRLVQQIDAKNQKIEFVYTSDPLGRLTARKIYNSAGIPVATNSYVYDSNQGESAYFVPKGALFKVTDREGWTKFGYDARGRTTNTTRFISTNNTTYTISTQYDDADRVRVVKYPTATDVRIRYDYDNAGHVTNIISLAGTGTQERFYSTPVFNALGQLIFAQYGANQQVTYSYYAKSKRLTNKVVAVGANIQDLSYQYDKVSNLKKITDAARPSGTNSASISTFSYDDLHRLTQLNSTALGVRNYSYDPIGNLMINDDLGGGLYSYHGSGKAHQVLAAGGKTYYYDNCGNMVDRGYQELQYDEENRLIKFNGPSPEVLFGYADDGTRLWRKVNGSELTVWIGGIYENRAGKHLCHVSANGQLIATFEPQGGVFAFLHRPLSSSHSLTVARVLAWPLQNGRTPITVMIATLLGILCVSILSRWQERRQGSRFRVRRSMFNVLCSCARPSFPSLSSVNNSDPLFGSPLSPFPPVNNSGLSLRPSRSHAPSFFRQALSVFLIVALVLATTPTHVEAQVFDPVFYYYHQDHLGSSNIMTDRAGNIVQQYEYTAYGQRRVKTSSAAFAVTHGYTGQHFDEATGLLFYQSRYYDPDIGRFIQADPIVPSASDPQMLNRYTYVGNNPFKYVDPSGNELITAIVIGVVVGAAIGGATAAATGGNIWMGILTGAIGGLFGGLGSWAGGALGGTTGAFAGAVAGGAAGGAVSAAVRGGDVAMGALTGAIAGGIAFGVNWLNVEVLKSLLPDVVATAFGGAIGGGIGAELQGGSFLEGAAYGAAGAIAGYVGMRMAIKAYARLTWKKAATAIDNPGEADLYLMADLDPQHVSGKDVGSHAWLALDPENGDVHTYGTWPTGENDQGIVELGGLKIDREMPRAAHFSLKTRLSPDQVKHFYYRVREYQLLGERGWTACGNCSHFSRNVWNSVVTRSGAIILPSPVTTPAKIAHDFLKVGP